MSPPRLPRLPLQRFQPRPMPEVDSRCFQAISTAFRDAGALLLGALSELAAACHLPTCCRNVVLGAPILEHHAFADRYCIGHTGTSVRRNGGHEHASEWQLFIQSFRLVAPRPSALQQLPERVPQHRGYPFRVAAWELPMAHVLRLQHACLTAFKVTVGLTSGIAYTQAIGVVSHLPSSKKARIWFASCRLSLNPQP